MIAGRQGSAQDTGLREKIQRDAYQSNGTLSKLLDVIKAQSMCWKFQISLATGIAITPAHFKIRPMKLELMSEYEKSRTANGPLLNK